MAFAGEPGLRSNEMGMEIVREIAKFRKTKKALMRHYIHVRIELFNKTGVEPIRQILVAGLADLFSSYGSFAALHM